ncbi:MAG: DUF447 family protein [Planctomycetia bacterium]|nr:DUF447 family protein [Planctomycetia bacterium]
MPLILEGLVTTFNADRTVNLAPMGPIVDVTMDRLLLRPFQSSTTFANLKRQGEGVFHVTDDVELLARRAIGDAGPLPAMRAAEFVDGMILSDACRWYAFRVRSIDDRHDRAEVEAEVVGRGVQREFFGFNRAKHAVLEAAILATRVGILPDAEIRAEMARLSSPVAKTGGASETAAFAYLEEHINRRLGVR